MKIKLLYMLSYYPMLHVVNLCAQQSDSLKVIKLEEVMVSAYRVKSDKGNIPNKVEVIPRRDILNIPSEDVSQLLKKTSCADIIEYPGLSSSISFRGFSPTALGNTYTLLLVNGIPAGTQNASTIDLNNAEQVEILKGPFSSFYGSGAMAGVVNLVTPVSRDSIKGSAGISYGSFKTIMLKVKVGGSISKKMNFDFSAKLFNQNKDYTTGRNNLLHMGNLEKDIMEDKSYNQTFKDTKFKKYNISGRLGYDFNNNWKVSLYEDVFIANKVFSHGNFWGIYGNMEKDIRRWSNSINIEGNISKHQVKFIPYFKNEDAKYYNEISDTNYVSSIYNYKAYGFVLQDAYNFGGHLIILGIDNNSQKFVSKQWASRDNRKAPYQPDYANIESGVFVQANFNFFDHKLNTTLGGRIDNILFKLYETDFIESKNSSETYSTFNPNIGIQYKIMPGTKIHTGAGKAFFAPDAFKKAGSYSYASKSGNSNFKGNPDLKPETSYSYDIGIGYENRKNGLSGDITFFNNHHKDMIVYDRSHKDTTSFTNANKARMNGIELLFAYDFGALCSYKYSLKLFCNLTHLITAETTIKSVTGNLKYVRKNNVSFGIDYSDFKRLSARISGRYMGHRYEDNWLYAYDSATKTNVPLTATDGTPIRPSLVNETILEHPDFLVFDFSCNYTIARKYTCGLAVQNLFDENYAEKDGYYMPGRMITASFSYSF